MKAQIQSGATKQVTNRIQAWLLPMFGLAPLAGQFALQVAGCRGLLNLSVRRPILVDAIGLLNLAGLGFMVVGLLIAVYRPENRIGRLSSLVGLGVLFMLLGINFVSCGIHGPLSLRLVNISAWLTTLFAWMVILLIFMILPLLFPDGQFPSPAWRRFTQVALAILALALLVTILWPGPIALFEFYGLAGLMNPVALQFTPPPLVDTLVDALMPVLLALLSIAASASLIQRWRHTEGEARQQLKWFAYFLASIGLIGAVCLIYALLIDRGFFKTWLYYGLLVAWWSGFPVVIGITVLRYHLYDIDIIIRRTLVYGVLTAALLGLYFAGVVALQELFQLITGQHQSSIATVLSTLASATLFNPLRKRIQNTIDQRFYRRRYNAEQTLHAFAATLRDEVDIEQLSNHLVAVVQETMQPESVSLWLRETGKRSSAGGLRK